MGRTHVELDLRDLRSLVGILSEGVADLDGLGLLGELGKKSIVYS